MPRVLHLDCTRGVSGASLLAALVDLGVAPSPVLHAVAGLGLPIDLRIDMCARGPTAHVGPLPVPARFEPRRPSRLVDALPLAPARLLATDALQRLALAGAPATEACPVALEVDAREVALVAAVAQALAALAPERVVVSRVRVPVEPDEALLDVLAPVAGALDFDGAEGCATREGAALLRAMVTGEEGWGAPEPAWDGPVARGTACEEPEVRVSLGASSS